MNIDFTNWSKRASTWLAALSASATAAAGAFVLMPAEWRASFPDWAGATCTIVAVASAALIPLATSYRQKALAKDDTDQAGV